MATGLVNVLIVTALPLEFAAVCERLANTAVERHPGGNFYRRGTHTSAGARFDVLVVEAGQGNNAAAVETERAISYFKPVIALFVGISGGIKDVQLGDVVVADEVFNYESGKAKQQFEPRPRGVSCTHRLIQAAREVSRSGSWLAYLPDTNGGPPTSKVGPILAGEKVVASHLAPTYQFFRSTYGHCLAVEMEAYGFLKATHQSSGVESLVVRGVSDLIEGKGQADESGSQPRAARHAAAFAFAVIDLFGGNDGKGAGASQPPATPPSSIPPTPTPSFPSPVALRERFLEASQTLLGWSTTVRGGHRIAMPAEHALLTRISEDKTSTSLIVGAKGVGKSALSAAVAGEAVRRGFAVLAIRADRVPADLASEQDLSTRHLGLPVPLTEAVGLLTGERKVLVVIDQLDSVSELTDRHSNRLNLLLNLVNRLSGRPNVHIIAATREFDFRHDARLCTIQADEVRLDAPPWEQFAPVLAALGHDPERVGAPTRELLRVPWHLNLYLRIARPGAAFGSLQALIEELWRQAVTNPSGPSGRADLLERIALRMSAAEELFVPAAIADDLAPARDALLQEDVIVRERDGLALAFRHQTYYDHALARLFARGKRSLADHVLEGQDGLFVRPAMLNGLEFLRTTAPDVYREQVRRIWGAAPRAHVRTLLLEFLASRSDPDAFEAGIVVPLLGTEQGPALLRAAAGSRGWFERLRDSAELAAWMRQPHDRAALCVGFLAGALVTDLECVRRLLVRHWVADPAYDALVVGVAQYVPKWDTAWVELVCASVRRSPVQIIWTANAVADSDPVLAPRLVRAQLDRELGQAEGQHAARVKATSSPDGDAPEETHFGSMRDEFTALLDGRNGDRYTLPEIAKNCPEPFLREVWPWLIAVLRRCPERHKHGTTYTDDRATWISADIRPIPLLEAIGAAASGWAEAAPDAFVAFALREADATEFLAAHRVLVRGFLVLPATHAAHALSYLLADPRRLAIGTFRNQYESTSALIAALASRLSAEQRRKLEDAVLHFEMYPVTDDARDAEYRRDLTRYNRQARLRLLRAFPAEHLSRETAAFRAQEENLLPGTRSFDSESCGGFVGPRMTADELAKASDADVLNVIEVVAERDAKGRESLWRFGVGRSGGTREEAGAFGALAEREPERVIGLLSKLRPPRDDPYAAAAIMGLAKSPLASDQLFRLVVDVHSRGFTSDDVRDRVADAVEHRASRRDPVPAGIVAMLETWLDEMAIPCPTAVIDDADDGAAAAKAPDGPIVFGHGGSLGILMHGRGAVARALGAAHGRRDPVNAAEMVRLLHTRAERERHPHVLAEMLTYFIPCFREPVAATAAYDAVIAACPAVLGLRLGIHALAELTGSADPTVRYEGWLDQMRAIQSPFVRQAYGELLFLYRARTSATGADARIAPLLAGDDVDALRGLAYGAAEAWSEAHCRAVATDILCAAARVPDEGIRRAITIAFIPPEERFTLDPDAKRVVAAVIEHQELLRHVGGQVLDALTPAAGIEPEVVAMACRAVLDLFASGSASGQMSTEVAGPLTSAALTLHRQPEYRAEGLRLFEELIRLGVHDAAAALALIDRRASANVGPTLLPRLRRRRR